MNILNLNLGETIGVVGVSSPANPERFNRGLENIKKLGFVTKVAGDPCVDFGRDDQGAKDISKPLFVAGSAVSRASHLMTLVEDPEVKVIICSRGAYGSFEILPLLDFEVIRKSKKVIVGFSDCTALLNAITQTNFQTMIHGPCVASEFSDYYQNPSAKLSVDFLVNLLSENYSGSTLEGISLRNGAGRGQLVGGNLTAFCSLLGTPWEPNCRGKILFLEDIGEKPFRVHRMLNQLLLSGKLSKLAGLVFGRFSNCVADLGPIIDEVLNAVPYGILAGYRFPIIRDLEFGHLGTNLSMPIGGMAEISDSKFSILKSK